MLPATNILKKSKKGSLAQVEKNENDQTVTSLISKETPKDSGKEEALIMEQMPWWATPANRLDKDLRKPNDPNYDHTTLFIPESEKSKLTPAMLQYWEFKSQNYDKVLLLKIGSFYEMFFDDAIIGARDLNLNWNTLRTPCVGFREKMFDGHTARLLDLGYKIAVVEKTETQEEMIARVKSYGKSSKEPKTLNRELSQILTKGTWNSNFEDFDSRYLLVLYKESQKIGFCLYEASILEILYGSLDDDPEQKQLRTLLWQTNPVEIVCNQKCEDFKKIFLNLPRKPLVEVLNENWSEFDSFSEIFLYEGNEITETGLKGLLYYLKKLMVLPSVQHSLHFKEYAVNMKNNSVLGLDYQTLRHLEVFYTNLFTRYAKTGSLFEFLDQTSSGFGHRLLCKWVSHPLNDVESINSRLDAIEDLGQIFLEREEFQRKLKTFPDIERIFIRIYQNLNKVDIIPYDEVPATRIKNFKTLLEYLRLAECMIMKLQANSEEFKSAHLFRLVNYEENGGIFPHCNEHINKLLEMVQWNENEPIPQPGFFDEYDAIMIQIKALEAELDAILCNVRKQFNDPEIIYSHAKYPYQLEIKEHHVKGMKKPENFQFTSSRAGYQRFLTPEIKEIIDKMNDFKSDAKKSLFAFVRHLYRHFETNSEIWQNVITILAELDCLCSISKISFEKTFAYSMSRPKFISSETPYLFLENVFHPCLVKNQVKFQPLTINFNQKKLKSPETIVLTGPNMGGKSTTLRTVGILAILAHIGCYVPASKCELTIIDSIYSRMGSQERLTEAKSSFYIELEETLNILRNSNERSLILLDELGKGTSTFDGVAIAYSVLKYFIEKIKARCIFTTHYHILAKEFERDERIDLFHMAFHIAPVSKHISFEYRLEPGSSDKSHGILLAKSVFEKVGLKTDIVEKANQICSEFEINEKFKKILKLI